LGLFIGPVLMALLVAIWREWLREVEMAEDVVPDGVAEIEGSPPQIEIVAEKKARA
ncbi:AI-2E family transporter, partial [Mesorhizobium sp. M7A.F.Ca.CA.001.06.1.1]